MSTMLLRPWFVILASAGAIERLCGVALGVSNEPVAGVNRPIALAQANAFLNRIDLLSEVVCTSQELFQPACDPVLFPDKFEVGNCCVTVAVVIANILSDVGNYASKISRDYLEARNALRNVIGRITIRIREIEMSPSSVWHYVSVLVNKIDLIKGELLNQQIVYSSHEQENLSSPSSIADARNTYVSFSFR